MEAPAEPRKEPHRYTKAEVLAEVKQNYELALLCILPGIENRLHKMKSSAKKMGVEPEDYELYEKMLLDSGLWILEGKTVKSGFEFFDVGDLSVPDFLAMTVHIVSRLQTENSYEYEYMSVATNRPAIVKFAGKVRKALNELYEESMAEGADKTCLFSWTHTGAIELEVEKKLGDQDE